MKLLRTVALAFLYYALLAPARLAFELARRDPLDRRAGRASYWRERGEPMPDASSLERPW